MDGFLYYRGEHQGAPGSWVLGCGHSPLAPCQKADHSHPEPNERVVFIPHFLHGLGFPLHPFTHGLMFYYGLDFHDLAPNFVLNISAFIVEGVLD